MRPSFTAYAMDAATTSTETDPNNPTETVVTTASIDRARICSWLSLAETATDAEIEGAIAQLKAKSGETETAQTSLQQMKAERDQLEADYKALFERQQELDKKQRAAEADAALEPVKGKITPEQFTKLRDLFLSNPEAATFSLSLLTSQASAEAEAGEGAPPKPTHNPENPGETGEDTADQRAAKLDALIKAIQGEGKFKDYSDAREEARRRQPELFQ